MWLIEWREERHPIRLAVTILPAFPVTEPHGAPGTALIDTGATISGITRKTAAALGLRRRGKLPLASVNGVSLAERYDFRFGLTPDYSPPNVPRLPFIFDQVIGIELSDSFEFDALLGMDVLGQCDFAMNRRGACRLVFG